MKKTFAKFQIDKWKNARGIDFTKVLNVYTL